MHSRVWDVAVSAGGSISKVFGVSPARYVGAYFRFEPSTLLPDVDIHNLGRDVVALTNVASDFLSELTPDTEKLISGDVTVVIADPAADGTAHVQFFFHYGD